MSLNIGGLLAGAGVVGQSMRAEEEAQRVARQNQLKIEEQNRLELLRQQQAKAAAPEAVSMGDMFGVGQQRPMDVEQVAPPQPATTTAVSPQTQAAAAQPNIPYGQEVQNPNYVPPRDDPLRAQAQARIDQHNARIKDLENSIANMVVRPGMSPDQVAQINRVRLTHFGQIEAEKRKRAESEAVLNRTSPTIDYGREGRNYALQQAQPQAQVAAAQQYDAAKTNYDDLMAKAAQANGIDPVIFKRLIGTESSFSPTAVSPRGEKFGLGIAQIAAVHGLTREQMLDPNTALPFAAQLFAKYLKEANGNYEEALYRYKGATSDQGRAAMAGPIATVLSGTQVAPTAAPAGQPAQVAQDQAPAQATPGPIASAATPGVKQTQETKSPTAYYAANPQSITGDQRILDGQYQRIRAEAIRKFQMAQQAGLGGQAEAIRDQIVQLDEGYTSNMRLLQGMAGVYQLEFGNDPRAVSAAMSYYTGQPVAFQPRSDGAFNMWVNGQKVGRPMTRDEVRSAAREMFDEKYREATAASRAKFGTFRAEEAIKQQGKLTEIQANMIKDTVVERVKGEVKIKQDALNKGWEIKPSNAGDGTFVLVPPLWMQQQGTPPLIYNPSGRTVEIDGNKIQDNSAIPITGLPSAVQIAGGR